MGTTTCHVDSKVATSMQAASGKARPHMEKVSMRVGSEARAACSCRQVTDSMGISLASVSGSANPR